ncbi:unnamed protein product [Symbiodinium necroappetens]|uniref:Uncharacterized protein n=1 Tax=Symbiodinium necroappetens TaxID=1628268 RepID=A0A812P689_9DINO|nr:unnamed protein product [Symbiodinium necroappetens]
MTSIADDEVNETAPGTVQGPEADRAWQLQVCTKCLKKKPGTGASQASRSSSTSNAFWNPYNHPSETSSRSSCDGEESNHPGSKEEGRARDDEIEVLPPPGGFLCPDDGYFERRSDDSDSEAEDQEQPAQREPQVNLYPAELNEPGRVQPVVVGPCKAGYAGGAPAAPAVEEKAPAIPCTPGRVFDMSREKKASFDTLGSLRDLQLAQGGDSNLIVEPAGCLKQCKHGPNVRAVSPDNELVGLAVTGMLPDEVEARCFRHVNDTAAAQRVFNSVRQALMLKSGGSSSPDRDKGAQPKLDATMGPMGSSTKEKQRRGRVRKSLENRLTNILEGLPVRFSGEAGLECQPAWRRGPREAISLALRAVAAGGDMFLQLPSLLTRFTAGVVALLSVNFRWVALAHETVAGSKGPSLAALMSVGSKKQNASRCFLDKSKLRDLPEGTSVAQVLPESVLSRDADGLWRYITSFNNAVLDAELASSALSQTADADENGVAGMQPVTPAARLVHATVGEAVQRAQSSPMVEALPTPTPSWLAGYGHQPLALGLIGGIALAPGWAQRRPRARRAPMVKVPLAADPKEESSSEEVAPKSGDAARVALVVQRLNAAETTLRRWGYVAEIVYTWLGLISLSVASFAAYSQGGLRAFQSSMGLGLTSVGLSVVCSLIGWFQARSCRTLGRRCGLAAGSLEPNGPVPPAAQMAATLPSLVAIETTLRARQRTAWLGAFFAVVGLQTMVGLMVGKVLATSGGFSQSPGINLDVFTLLAVSNSALGHVLAGGLAALQQGSLPQPSNSDDPFQGWSR